MVVCHGQDSRARAHAAVVMFSAAGVHHCAPWTEKTVVPLISLRPLRPFLPSPRLPRPARPSRRWPSQRPRAPPHRPSPDSHDDGVVCILWRTLKRLHGKVASWQRSPDILVLRRCSRETTSPTVLVIMANANFFTHSRRAHSPNTSDDTEHSASAPSQRCKVRSAERAICSPSLLPRHPLLHLCIT